MRFWGWLGLNFAELLGDVVWGRRWAARRRVRRVLCDLCFPGLPILCLFGGLCIPCFLFFFRLLYLQFSPRVVPLYVICSRMSEIEKRELTGLLCANGTSTEAERSSCNSMPSLCCPFRA